MVTAQSSVVRSFGLDLVGDIPWGTHLCQFYETKKDLVDILVPYFAEGLRNNEFCMWVASEPLEVDEAKRALRKAVPDLDKYVGKCQIEILSYADWYVKDGKFDADRVLQGWVEKEKAAVERGFEGLRLTGNTFWVERKDWKSFTDYEALVNDVIGSHRMIALCTYCLKRCKGTDVVDVMRNHWGTLIRKGKEWNLVEDVAGRRQAEEAAEKSEEEHREFLESLAEGVWVADKQGKTISVNSQMAKMLGYTLDEMKGKSMLDFMNHGIDAEKSVKWGRKSGRHMQVELEFVRKDGVHVVALVSTSYLTDEKGEYVGSISGVVDITDRKRAETELLRSEQKYRNLFTFMGSGFAHHKIISDASGQPKDYIILEANPAFRRLFNHEGDVLLGRKITEIFPEIVKDQFNWVGTLARVATTGENCSFEAYFQPLDKWFSVSAYNSEKDHFVAIYDDVTEKKKAEEHLRNLASFPEENPEPVIRVAKEGTILFSNRAGLSVLREWKSEVGQTAPDKWIRFIRETVDSGSKKTFEETCGEQVFSFTVAPFASHANVYGHDITLRRHLEERLYQSEKRYRTLYETMTDGIVHTNIDGRINECNDAFAKMLGYSKDELKTMTYQQLMPEKWHDQESKIIQEVVTEGFSDLYEKEYVKKDGSIIIVNVRNWLARDDTGKPVGIWKLARDITTRKMLEKTLRESQTDLSRAQAVAKVGSWRLDVRRNELLWSDETYRMFGIPKDTPLTYEKFLGMVHADDKGYVDQQWSAALSGVPYDIEHRIVVDGEIKWVREKAELEFDKDGKLQGGFGTVQDITERKRMEQKVLQASREWERTFESVPDLIAILDNQHKIVRANRAMAQQLGLTPEQCIGLPCYKYVHGTNQPPEFCPHAQTLKDGEQHMAEVHEERLGGDFLVSTTPLVDEKGQMIGSVHVARNITERKKIENQLRETRDYLDSLLNYANAPIIVWDPEFKITMFNHAFERLTGLSSTEAVGKPLDILFPKEQKEEAMHHIQRTLAGEHWETVEIPIIHKDGTVKTLLWNSANINDRRVKRIIATIAQGQDITERKKMEASIEQYAKHLEDLVEEKSRQLKDAERLSAIGQTAGMVGHDIRNPLQSILTATYLVKDDLAVLPESEQKNSLLQSVQEIEEQAAYIDKIIVDLQDYARTLRPYLEEINLEPTINNMLSNFKVPQNIEVKTKFDDEAKKLVTDSGCITRILNNLISNAIQAMPNGGKLTISSTKQMKDTIITVEDTGIGIPNDIKSKVFQPLFTTKSKGQGFGLAVVKRFAEALGGTITFESQQDKGTSFTLRLPSTNEQHQADTVNKS